MSRLLTYAAYPMILSLSSLVGYYLYQSMDQGLALILSVSLGFVLVFSFEFLHPETKDWRPKRKEVYLDIFHSAFSNTLPNLLFKVLFFSLCLSANQYIVTKLSFKLWPTHIHPGFQLVLGLVCAELGFYSLHRFLHNSKYWPLHSLHHSVERMYILAGSRTHPLQVFATYGGQMMILWLLGAPDYVIFFHALFTSVNGLLQHANIKMKFGLLNYIFATPELHRWHHSQIIKESNSNYGTNMIFWDLLLGTRYLPEGRDRPEALGLMPEDVIPLTFKDHMLSAFKNYKQS